MNSQTAVDLNVGLPSASRFSREAGRTNIVARISARFRPAKNVAASQAISGSVSSYRIGEVVHHGQFGTGRVVACWPDGRLQVKFADSARSRFVFPSFLD